MQYVPDGLGVHADNLVCGFSINFFFLIFITSGISSRFLKLHVFIYVCRCL